MNGSTHVSNWQLGWWLALLAFVTGAGIGLFFHRTLFDVNYEPALMSPEELRHGMRWLTEKLYDDDGTKFRRKGFLALMKAQRSADAGVVSV